MVPNNFPKIMVTCSSDVDVIVSYFQSHPRQYDSTAESWMEDTLRESGFTEYYQKKMRRAVQTFTPITNRCYMLGKPRKVIAKVEKLRGLKEQLERELYRVRQLRVEQECLVLRLHQPVASLVVTGLNKTIKAEKLPSMHEGDVVFIFALAATSNSTRGFKSNMEIYGTYHNALAMGIIEEYEDMPKDCYVGFVKVGPRMKDGTYGVKEAYVFDGEVKELQDGTNTAKHKKADKSEINIKNGVLRVPLCDDLWNNLMQQEGHFYLYWKPEFSNFFSTQYGIGNENGLLDIIFVHGLDEKRFRQNEISAVAKRGYVSSSDNREFTALVFDFEKLSPKKKYEETSFSILRKQEWILDWKCVKFKNGYFVVVPPVDESVKFKPQAFSKPGVVESYNYLKEYLNDRLSPVRCTVEELKLTIYDTIRLDEAIARFATVSKQRAVRTSGMSTKVKIAPQQMSFKQALSKAQQMTAEEYEKYKSEYINHLVRLQSKDYKVIPCVERLSHANNDVTEYAFMFSLECRSGNILIVHENVNPDRSTLLFWVKKTAYDKAIREIYDFLQSAEINKRSGLRGGSIDVGNVGIIRYKSINHDDMGSWKKAIKVCTVGYYVNL